MVDLPDDDDGSWSIPSVLQPAVPPLNEHSGQPNPKRKARAKPKRTKRKGNSGTTTRMLN